MRTLCPLLFLMHGLSIALAQDLSVHTTAGFNSKTKVPNRGFKTLKEFVIGLEELSPTRFQKRSELTSVIQLKIWHKQLAYIDYDFFSQYNSKFNLMPQIGFKKNANVWDLIKPTSDYKVSYSLEQIGPFRNIVEYYQSLNTVEDNPKLFAARYKLTPPETLKTYNKIIASRNPFTYLAVELKLTAWRAAGFNADPQVVAFKKPKALGLGYQTAQLQTPDFSKGFQSLDELKTFYLNPEIDSKLLSDLHLKLYNTSQKSIQDWLKSLDPKSEETKKLFSQILLKSKLRHEIGFLSNKVKPYVLLKTNNTPYRSSRIGFKNNCLEDLKEDPIDLLKDITGS